MAESMRNPFTRELLSRDVLLEWQSIIDSTAGILQVPAGLITRVDGDQIEILLSSVTLDNPYTAGYVTGYPDSGWYCEHTLKTRGLNFIPDARLDPAWQDNAAVVGLNMVSYVGLPIHRPDEGEFGTICFLDNKANPHNDLYIKLLHQVKRMLELSLRIIFDKGLIAAQERLIQDLSKVYPICCYCKKVREETGDWVDVEVYVREVAGRTASHGVCPDCFEREMKRL